MSTIVSKKDSIKTESSYKNDPTKTDLSTKSDTSTKSDREIKSDLSIKTNSEIKRDLVSWENIELDIKTEESTDQFGYFIKGKVKCYSSRNLRKFVRISESGETCELIWESKSDKEETILVIVYEEGTKKWLALNVNGGFLLFHRTGKGQAWNDITRTGDDLTNVKFFGEDRKEGEMLNCKLSLEVTDHIIILFSPPRTIAYGSAPIWIRNKNTISENFQKNEIPRLLLLNIGGNTLYVTFDVLKPANSEVKFERNVVKEEVVPVNNTYVPHSLKHMFDNSFVKYLRNPEDCVKQDQSLPKPAEVVEVDHDLIVINPDKPDIPIKNPVVLDVVEVESDDDCYFDGYSPKVKLDVDPSQRLSKRIKNDQVLDRANRPGGLSAYATYQDPEPEPKRQQVENQSVRHEEPRTFERSNTRTETRHDYSNTVAQIFRTLSKTLTQLFQTTTNTLTHMENWSPRQQEYIIPEPPATNQQIEVNQPYNTSTRVNVNQPYNTSTRFNLDPSNPTRTTTRVNLYQPYNTSTRVNLNPSNPTRTSTRVNLNPSNPTRTSTRVNINQPTTTRTSTRVSVNQPTRTRTITNTPSTGIRAICDGRSTGIRAICDGRSTGIRAICDGRSTGIRAICDGRSNALRAVGTCSGKLQNFVSPKTTNIKTQTKYEYTKTIKTQVKYECTKTIKTQIIKNDYSDVKTQIIKNEYSQTTKMQVKTDYSNTLTQIKNDPSRSTKGVICIDP
ncbi:hypothetical protein TpMuguga_01g00494 [Theileria parva strain Muguga]|uniref:Uncharacterized protein n=1 Tax=Theileria parva TaxID=5875 RepID=Q4N8H7_THEPA|nr:uncharacterized protein TpMuguga_01g00494 [Theileria parva strain Muguga]EAN33731.1 hypothetical protein TpMuguga_01g00494 [Theileria parva strain Muguga]|eukprot:XP_766014.1 hypothetical protein [Theileria parva strain Muguga]